MSKLTQLIFNTTATDPIENKEVIQAIGLNTISSVGGANGAEGTYSIPGEYKPLFELKNGTFKLLESWRNWKAGHNFTPYELLVAMRFESEAEALEFLNANGWGERPKDNLIFTNGKFDAYKTAVFLVACGFIRVSQINRDEIKVYNNDGGILKEFNYRSDTLDYLSKQLTDTSLINKLHSSRSAVVAVWQLVPGTSYDLQLDNRHEIFLPFRGKVLKVTADGMTFVDYESLAMFMPVKSMGYDFDYTDEIGVFEKFLKYGITGSDDPSTWTDEDRNNILAFMTSIGYLLSSYRDPSLNKAIIYSDFGADGESRNGRRGKSLILVAIALLRKTMLKPDDAFRVDYQFKFSDLDETYKVYVLDDVPKNFNFYSLFTQITGGISCERKGKPATEIEPTKTPKWGITSNFVVPFQNDEESVMARYAEYQVKPFWSSTNTPRDYFKSNFFSEEWDSLEWDKFYSFMARCAQSFLKRGLIEISIDKKESRYLAYIGNNVAKLQEMERILFELESYTSFNVDDFLKLHYKNIEMRYDRVPLWTHNNVKRDVDIWIEYHNLDIKYSQRVRKWEKIDNPLENISIGDTSKADEFPF